MRGLNWFGCANWLFWTRTGNFYQNPRVSVFSPKWGWHPSRFRADDGLTRLTRCVVSSHTAAVTVRSNAHRPLAGGDGGAPPASRPASGPGLLVFESRHAPGSAASPANEMSKFFLVIASHARWECGGRQYLLGPDTVCHIPAGQVFTQETSPHSPVVTYALHYLPELLDASVRGQLDALGMIAVDLGNAAANQGHVIRSIFQEMLFEQDARQEGWEVILQSRLQDLGIRVLRLARRRSRTDVPLFEPGSDSTDRVARYALRLRSQFTRQETLPEAARSVGLSRRQFTDLFRKVTGQSWGRYILTLRLQHATGLLTETSRAVSVVAFESGFQDLSHFHHSFKSAYGCSPLSYREQRRVRLSEAGGAGSRAEREEAASANFKFRGMKGWFWSPEQYLEEIPVLAELKLNFLMNCYGSMIVNRPGEPWCNEWWKPMSGARKDAYARIIRSCAKHGINFCFAVHPQVASPRPLQFRDDGDFAALWQHYAWAQQQGVRWFSLCLDGTVWGSGGPEEFGALHAELANALFARLQAADTDTQLIFCPAIYWGDATHPEHHAYFDALGRKMHPGVRVFWSGDSIVNPRVTRVAAESYGRAVKHRLFLWDNYPVNDGSPTLHLGPVSGRAADLCEVVDGYLCNSMCSQNQISRLPVATCADYAHDPGNYNPARSISQAIQRFGRTRAQRQVLKDLVEAYPGFIVEGGGTGTNPVRAKFGGLLAGGDSHAAAQNHIARMEDVVARLTRLFPARYPATRRTVLDDIEWMKQQLS